MKKTFTTKNMVITALLIALGIIIPTAFGFLKVVIPPAFTATLTAHVPIFIAMFISPISALLTAIGTTLGFLITGLPMVVTVRAASHIVFALIGVYMIKKGSNLVFSGVVTALLHALFEAIVVYAFLALGITTTESSYFMASFYVVGIGTLIHHTIDFVIAAVIMSALSKTRLFPKMPKIW